MGKKKLKKKHKNVSIAIYYKPLDHNGNSDN